MNCEEGPVDKKQKGMKELCKITGNIFYNVF